MSNITLQSNALPKRDRQAERVTRMAQVLQSFSSGFTLRPVHLNVVKDSGVPAWSSSDRIWIDETMLDDLTTAKGVASIKGLTLHEIAHILLTPRAGSDLGSWVQENSQYHTVQCPRGPAHRVVADCFVPFNQRLVRSDYHPLPVERCAVMGWCVSSRLRSQVPRPDHS